MNPPLAYAHTVAGRPESEWELLPDHHRNSAERARDHAAVFGSAEWGELGGWWHDIGKYLPDFDARLHGGRVHVDHAFLGAALALSKGEAGLPLAFAIAGHHTGLANLRAAGGTRQKPLLDRIGGRKELASLLAFVPSEVADRPLPPFPVFLPTGRAATLSGAEDARRRTEFWTRFLFSALVDADFLATEAFYSPGKRAPVREFDSLPELLRMLNRKLREFSADSAVNRLRARVLADCRAAAKQEPGLFSLTVPTGGGKTLSFMAFALEHVKHWRRHRRVVVVIPYTSIIEQNAKVYRDVFGDKNVVEHHSSVDEAARMEENGEVETRRRLAAENWDAPVVVTTNVQFFESLFANLPSRCRKLHNLAGSVIVLDEAQAIPTEFLNCTLDALRELVDVYGCTVLLSTATQPALHKRDELPGGLENVREIVREPVALARSLDRVTIRWPAGEAPTPYPELATQVAAREQVLVIVDRRRDARRLAKLVPDAIHLSALMCPAHRAKVLEEIRGRLERGERCRVVATQLVEAGVDVDFPEVYRAMAGLDSLAQAAGRCNRNGTLTRNGVLMKGEFIVFRAEAPPPRGYLLKGMRTTESLLNKYGDRLSFSSPVHLDEYFRSLYAKCDKDASGVQTQRALFNFATVAEKVKLIEDGYQSPVVVLWGEGRARAEAFRTKPTRATQRALQPYIVQVPESSLEALRAQGAVEWVHESVYVLSPHFENLYDDVYGLLVDAPAGAATRDPE